MSKHPKGVLRILFRICPFLGQIPGTRNRYDTLLRSK